MKKLIAVALVAMLAVTAVLVDTKPAEARRWGGGGIAAGAIIGGLVLGGIVASRHRHRNYSYGYYPSYRSYGYAQPYYYGSFGGWRGHRHHRHHRRW